MERTLVILLGNPRGGEKAWDSMYNNLLFPYNADLALCFGFREDKSISLYERAKYIWEIPEYEEWAYYYVENLGEEGYWKKSFVLGSTTGFSGIYGTRGSSAITLAFRHYLLKNKREIICSYDRIILTRSDFFYVKEHPILPNDHFWVPSGENFGGMTDRHHIFPSSDIDDVFGIIERYVNTEKLFEDYKDNPDSLNIESCYLKYFDSIEYSKKIREFPSVSFTVKTQEDATRWYPGNGSNVPYNDDLFLKYEGEYEQCMKNIFCQENILSYRENFFKEESEKYNRILRQNKSNKKINISKFTICLHCGCNKDIVNQQMERLKPLEEKYEVYWNNRIDRHPEIYESYAKMINHSVATSPTEWVILINDRTLPTAEEVGKMIDLLESGFACVLLYNVGFMGFSKELIRKIGWWDERFTHAGWEDRDWIWRICMNNFALYESQESTYDRSWKTTLTNSSYDSTQHWYNKYDQSHDGVIYKNLPEEIYSHWDKFIGEYISEISNSWNTWDKSSLDIMYNYDIDNPLERSGSSMIGERKIIKNY